MANIGQVILGKEGVIRLALACILARGHLHLLEDLRVRVQQRQRFDLRGRTGLRHQQTDLAVVVQRVGGQVLAAHRVALVGHGAGALLPLAEGLLHLVHVGALQVADLDREALDRATVERFAQNLSQRGRKLVVQRVLDDRHGLGVDQA